MDDVVESAFEERHQHFAGVLRRARGEREVAAELALEEAVEPLELLLLAEADAVLAQLRLAVAVHTRRDIAPLDRALWAFAARAFEEQLHAFTPAQLADRIDSSGHCVLALSSQL